MDVLKKDFEIFTQVSKNFDVFDDVFPRCLDVNFIMNLGEHSRFLADFGEWSRGKSRLSMVPLSKITPQYSVATISSRCSYCPESIISEVFAV